ncbi:hypothetical protein Q0L23_29595 (plasmid) [Klebsiella michiganensis]|uniref:helix-turn-helix transcriptional regulator n=1 Tax=Klebsiella michiganensis TaxID=1134687 RepID=UPI00265832B5|nr:hypothetical protein [Klebsiella michiganensis]WKJ95767.1 hypothetical protein Q0L46_16505 [Klebsiella michiganensis]WKK00969.1 hypothetical protein Q0L46_29400 [Klebsiella michiganensis]WKK02887.1 hypothetical protein Q0L23_23795 [Klebsiella michiganensis]WKK06992.1 hypothetical protein Q0L23_29595 [Klebsiella michiganensis]
MINNSINTITISFEGAFDLFVGNELFLIDDELLVLYKNQKAKDFNSTDTIISLSEGYLKMINRKTHNKILSYINSVKSGEVTYGFSFHEKQDCDLWLININNIYKANIVERGVVFKDCFVISMTNITSTPGTESLAFINDILKLTPTEIKICIALIKGKNLRQAAEYADISYEHARQRLKVIFSKTATSNQVQLISFLNRAMIFSLNTN